MRVARVSKNAASSTSPDSPLENYVYTSLKVVGYLASIWLFVKVGIPNLKEGIMLKNSVPHPRWNSVTVEQREIFRSGLNLALLGYFACVPAILGTSYFSITLLKSFD